MQEMDHEEVTVYVAATMTLVTGKEGEATTLKQSIAGYVYCATLKSPFKERILLGTST